ncbi:MAG TPA: adenylate kinase, partial [Candidatus Binatia bacterium]|nr:adenylate kinase [Candidatus Binatia bacterium]
LWHMTFSPPRKPGICDRCGGELYQRQDDEEQTVAHRLQVYEQQTAPLVQYYRNRKLLREIDGVGPVEQVRARVFAALEDVVA